MFLMKFMIIWQQIEILSALSLMLSNVYCKQESGMWIYYLTPHISGSSTSRNILWNELELHECIHKILFEFAIERKLDVYYFGFNVLTLLLVELILYKYVDLYIRFPIRLKKIYY